MHTLVVLLASSSAATQPNAGVQTAPPLDTAEAPDFADADDPTDPAAPADGDDVPAEAPVTASPDDTAPRPPEDAAPAEAPTDPDLDPLAPILTLLDDLAQEGFRVTEQTRSQSAFQGDFLTARIAGSDANLLAFASQSAAEEGFQILLAPEGPDAFRFIALRARAGQARGVDFVDVDDVEIVGRFREREDASMLRKYAGFPPGGVVPIEVAERLATVGYRTTFRATGAGQLEIRVEPGRAIRRLRLRRHLPLPEREVSRVLSPRSRPGTLAMAPCVARSSLGSLRGSICPPTDLACQRWEAEETARIERYLFDQGYFKGTARLGLTCGKSSDEADLWILFDKGRSYRIGKIEITGNVGSADHRWIRRMFRPTLGPFLPIPKRVTRAHIEDAKDRVEREYAEPRGGPRTAPRSSLQLPYPGVRVDTNFDRISRPSLPDRPRRIPLTVDVQLGSGVQTQFQNNDRVAESRLRPQLQLFERREPATPATATREAENLRSYYQSRGFVLAKVHGDYDTRGLLTRLRFDIDEGPKVRIREVDFSVPLGVSPVVQTTIRRNYRRGRKLTSGGTWSDNAARTDLGLLLKTYADAGYLCAQARMRIAFWPEGLDQSGAHALFDPSTPVETTGDPTWIERQFSADGLAALRERPRAGLYIRIEVEPGPRVLTSGREVARHVEIPIPPSREVESLPVTRQGHWDARRMFRDGPLRREGEDRAGGVPLRLGLEREAERAVERRYREEGFPLADAEMRWLYTDDEGQVHRASQAERLTAPEVGLCTSERVREVATVDTEISVYEGRQARFGTTLLRGNFKTRDWVLTREIPWKEGERYNRQSLDLARRRIEGTGTVESVQIHEQPTDCDLTDDPDQKCVVHQVIGVTESKDRAMDVEWGFGFATLDPFYVFLRPSFPNMLGTGWDLRIDTHFGTNVRIPRFCSAEEDCYERTGRMSLLRQRIFASALSFEISGQVQRRATPARGIIDSALGEVRLSLPVRDEWRFYWSYFIQGANISKSVVKPALGGSPDCGDGPCRPPNRSESIVPDLTGALQSGVTWQRVDNAFNPDRGFMADADVTLASPYLGGLDWWVRVQAAWQHFIPLPGREQRFSFRYALRYGHAIPLRNLPGAETTSVPEVWRFFGGGTADLGMRGIEPQMMLVDIESLPLAHGGTLLRPSAQGGHIRALATFALQVVTVRDFLGGRLAHSVFVDLGVLTQRWRDVVPLRDIRRSVGINFIKWDINIVTVSLGYAILVPNAIIPGNVRPTDDRNGRVVFDVGATF